MRAIDECFKYQAHLKSPIITPHLITLEATDILYSATSPGITKMTLQDTRGVTLRWQFATMTINRTNKQGAALTRELESHTQFSWNKGVFTTHNPPTCWLHNTPPVNHATNNNPRALSAIEGPSYHASFMCHLCHHARVSTWNMVRIW